MRSFFPLPAVLCPLRVFGAPYIVTNYVELSIFTEAGYTEFETTMTAQPYTYTIDVTPDVTPFSALSTYTADSDYTDVTVIEVVLPTSAAQEITADFTADALETSYVVPITYTPSATCSQNWTFTTTVPVYIPDGVVLPPVTVSTSVTLETFLDYKPTPSSQVIAVVNPTDIASDDLASASSLAEPFGMSYCYTPTSYCPTTASATCTPTFAYDPSTASNNFHSDPSSFFYDNNSWLAPIILIAVLVPVGWILIWLIIGLVESWLSFKGVMLGLHRKRGVPYAWCCISIFFLCCVGPTYKAKSAEEQAVLRERWNAMKKREKLKLWAKWGFRWKYPEMLGDEPELAKRPLRQSCL